MASSWNVIRSRPSPLANEAVPSSVTGGSTHLTPPDYALSGIIGAELSEPLANMQQVLQDIENTRHVSREHIKVLNINVIAATKLAMQSQQIARLAGGRLRQSHETLKLDELVLGALKERAGGFRKRGIEIFQRIKPVEVIVDAGLLYSLVDAALDWAASQGRKLTVTLDMKNWPEHGLLILKAGHVVASSTPGADEDRPSGDTLGWHLVNEISQAMGLSVQKASNDQETTLTIEFPRTVRRLEGLTAVEMQTGPESMYGESRPMAGTRILLITHDVRLQVEVRSICQGTGLVLDCVSSAEQGMRFCEMEAPNLVIIDQEMRNHVFDELYENLRKIDPDFPFIEIASAPNTLEMAGWTSESMSRLSRDVLANHLAATLVMDLAKVM